MDSSPDNDGTDQYCQMVRVRLVRQKGVREEPVSERFSRQSSGSNLADQGRVATHTHTQQCEVTPWPVDVAGREAMVKVCGVAVARLQGHSWAPTLSNGQKVNVGTVLLVPHRPAACWSAGEARCRLIPTGRDRGPVVVRDRESRSHGEGVQCV